MIVMNPVRMCLPALVIAFLTVSSTPYSDAECFDSVPNHCTFTDLCGWITCNWTINDKENCNAPCLTNMVQCGKLTSDITCVTHHTDHCVTFKYKAKKYTQLSLTLTRELNSLLLLQFNSSQTNKWTNVSVPVCSNSDFTLIIIGKIKKNKVCIVDIVYKKPKCDDEMKTTVTSSETSPTSPEPTTITPSTYDTTIVGSDVANSTSAAATNTESKTTLSPAEDAQGAADASADVGTIVGAVLAVVIIISLIILVILVVLFRRKHLLCWKTQSENKPTTIPRSVDKGGGNHDLADVPTYDHYTEIGAIPSYRYSSTDEARASRLSMENYSVVSDVDQDESSLAFQLRTSLYCLPQTVLTGTDNPAMEDSLEDPYEISDDGHHPQRQQDPENDDYNVICLDKRDEDGSHTYSNQSPYDHIHTTAKYDGKGRELHETEKNVTERPYHLPQQNGWHLALGDSTSQNPQPKATGVYHILEGQATQSPHNHSTSSYQLARAITSQASENQNTSVYHILEDSTSQDSDAEAKRKIDTVEDSAPRNPEAGDTSVYHILEENPEQTPQPPIDDYSVLEDSLPEGQTTQDPRDPSQPQLSPFPCEEETDYNRLHFDRSESEVRVTEGGGGDGMYSHLKGGGEDTYDEAIRDRKLEVIDDDYSHI